MHSTIFIPLVHRHINDQCERMARRSGFDSGVYLSAVRANMIDQLCTALCLLAESDNRARDHVMALAEQYAMKEAA